MSTNIHTLNEFQPSMFSEDQGLLVSIYLPTHPHTSDNQQDRLQFKNLMGEAQNILSQEYGTREFAGITKLLLAISEDIDREIWRFTKEGLGILLNNNNAYVYHLDYPVEAGVFVADSYHIRPLIKNFQYGAHYYMLALSAKDFSLYTGDFNGFEKMELPDDIMTEFTEVFGEFDGGQSESESYGKTKVSYYGQNSKNDLVDKDTEKFFRYVDKTVNELIGSKRGCPLILVSLTQNQAVFRSLATIPTLLDKGIEKPFSSMGDAEMLDDAISIIRSRQESSIKDILNEYGLALSQERASSDLRTIAHALVERKVSTLLVDEGTVVLGGFDKNTGSIELASSKKAGVDDLIDDLAQAAYLQNGDVYVVDPESLPDQAKVAALFRY